MQPNLKPYYRDALMAFGRMSGWVAGPVVIALLLGKWLDKRYGTSPYIFIAFVAGGFFISVFGILRESKRYAKQAEATDRELAAAKEVKEE